MLNIKHSTRVPGNHKDIIKKFDRQLFEALAPPIGKLNIKEFTGSKKGDVVHLEFESPIKATWISDITSDYQDDTVSYFVDEGRVLPSPLTKWKHKHIIKDIDGDSSLIIDDIYFEAGNKLLSLLIYPFLYLSFYPRRFVYKKYFKNV